MRISAARRLLSISGLAFGLALGLIWALGAAEPSPAESPALESKAHYHKIARVVADGLPQTHVSHARLGDTVAEKALTNYLRVLDFDRTYFFASDVASFRQRAGELDDDLRDGHLAFAYEVFALFKQRAEDRVAYVNELLEKGFDLDVDESYQIKRKEAPWPDSARARDDLWRRKIKHEYVSRMVAKAMREEFPPDEEEDEELDDDIRELVDKTPEELVRKMHEQFLTVLQGHDEEWVLQAYLNAFTTAYDAHSAYLSPRSTEDFDIAMKLSLTGIGAVLKYDDGAAKIVRLIAGGPAEQDGRLGPGDRIVAVAQGDEEPVDILYWPLYKSVRLIRGEKGTRVVLLVQPASDPSGATVRQIALVRDKINLEERAAKAKVHNLPGDAETDQEYRLGVITLPDFYADQQGLKKGKKDSKSSARDVRNLLADLQDQNVDGILLDLRNNGGGSLQEAVEMTGFFIDRGPIVQVKANRRVQKLKDPNGDTLYEGPLVVLVNRMSASASEILASALQDYERAIIVGDSKTHGKGTVQSVFPVDRGNPRLGSLKITTAGFYRIDGHSTQLKGVEPDIVIPSALDVMEIGEEFLPNHLSLSWVSPTRYNRYPNLQDEVKTLQQKSTERLAANEEFIAYKDVVARLKQQLDREAIPIRLEKRLQIAREDREITELQEAIRDRFAAGDDGDEDDAAPDLILSEALHILRDFVELVEAHQEVDS